MGGAGAGGMAGGQTPGLHISVPPTPHTGCLQVFCRGVHFTFHLVGDSQSLTLAYF